VQEWRTRTIRRKILAEFAAKYGSDIDGTTPPAISTTSSTLKKEKDVITSQTLQSTKESWGMAEQREGKGWGMGGGGGEKGKGVVRNVGGGQDVATGIEFKGANGSSQNGVGNRRNVTVGKGVKTVVKVVKTIEKGFETVGKEVRTDGSKKSGVLTPFASSQSGDGEKVTVGKGNKTVGENGVLMSFATSQISVGDNVNMTVGKGNERNGSSGVATPFSSSQISVGDRGRVLPSKADLEKELRQLEEGEAGMSLRQVLVRLTGCLCVAACCSVLHRVAVCCNLVQCVSSASASAVDRWFVWCKVVERVAACCRVVQGVVIWCSVSSASASAVDRLLVCSRMLECVALGGLYCSVLQCVAVCFMCGALCCSVMYCGAVCCSVWQCDAVCCSVSHRHAHFQLKAHVQVFFAYTWGFLMRAHVQFTLLVRYVICTRYLFKSFMACIQTSFGLYRSLSGINILNV